MGFKIYHVGYDLAGALSLDRGDLPPQPFLVLIGDSESVQKAQAMFGAEVALIEHKETTE
jgi:hypothetical protein